VCIHGFAVYLKHQRMSMRANEAPLFAHFRAKAPEASIHGFGFDPCPSVVVHFP
jgi:hypothetical protein